MSNPTPLTPEAINAWADDPRGPVALTLREMLRPVEEGEAIVFPPTFAAGENQSPYNIDTLGDGTKLALIDSVGAQANRIEPIFKAAPSGKPDNALAKLVPQIDITYGNEKTLSIFEAGHRLGDAIVRCTELAEDAQGAFQDFRDRGDATPLAKLAPTSLVFGAWDSRDTQAKLPRIVQSVIRAYDVDELTRSAQFFPAVDFADEEVGLISKKDKTKAEADAAGGRPKSAEAKRGYVAVPAVRSHGGVLVRGRIERRITVNLVAVRNLDGEDGDRLRRYVLGLALVAAAEPGEAFLRAGCLVTRDPDEAPDWVLVDRAGRREAVHLNEDVALTYAKGAADAFGVGDDRRVSFDAKRAKQDLKAKEDA